MVAFTLIYLALHAFSAVSATYIWPNHVMDELEHLLVDGDGFNAGGVKAKLTPCTTSAPLWLRTAFHDVATADVSAGTGGLDASIGFETNRAENGGGPAMNNTVGFFASYVNAYLSMADLIGLGVVSVVATCSPTVALVPFRGGRIDATEGGAFGVPAPETSLTDTMSRFATAGFNNTEAIALTACGHSIGAVHRAGFPQVVKADVNFDETPGSFDIDVITDYLDSTGLKGGALVTTTNVTVQSDLRLFASDNNVTMQSLGASADAFMSQCIAVFAHMIDTVPSSVTLTDLITPNVVKPVDVLLTVDDIGNVTISGYIRLLSTEWSESAVVTLTWTARTGSTTGSISATSAEAGTSVFGDTYYHSFSAAIDAAVGISAFTITVVDGSTSTGYDNGGSGYPVEDSVIWLPADSSVSSSSVAISAAVLTSVAATSVDAVFSIPTAQSGNLSPKITSSTLTLAEGTVRGLYTVYTGSTSITSSNADQTSIDIVIVTGDGTTLTDEFKKLNTAA